MTEGKRILAVIHDPGACGMLLPVLRELSLSKRENFFLFAGDFVKNRLTSNGIPFREIGSNPTEAEVLEMFSISDPKVVLTGTGWGTSLVQKVRNFAGRENLESVAVVDYWVGYLERWQGADVPLNQIRDEICVIDDFMKGEMLEIGFPSRQIHVTGHPYLEELSLGAKPRSFSSMGKVLLLSEPIRDQHLSQFIDSRVRRVAETLQNLAENLNSKAEIHFKAHPKEDCGLPRALSSRSWNRLSFKLADSQFRSPEDFQKFDLVIGYQTMGLLEAAVMGVPTVSVPFSPLSGAVANAFKNAGVLVVGPQESLEKVKFEFRRTSKNQYAGATHAILKRLLGSEV